MTKKRKLQLISAIFLLCFVIIHTIITHNKFEVIFFDVGQGDSTLIKFKDNSTMLIDCGANKKVLSKLGKYLPFYKHTIDYLVITHFDLDHYGGCIDVLDRYNVKNIIHNGGHKYDDYFKEFKKFQSLEKANEYVINSSNTIYIASSTIQFLWPQDNIKEYEGNNNSVVFKLINNQTSFLFTGDMEIETEELLLNEYCQTTSTYCNNIQANILKAGHHGSGGSTSEEFLLKVNPKTVIISVGNNRYGHPSERILSRINRYNIDILRTDEGGDIVINQN